jgi:hypothetical protein
VDFTWSAGFVCNTEIFIQQISFLINLTYVFLYQNIHQLSNATLLFTYTPIQQSTYFVIYCKFQKIILFNILNLSDPTSDLVRQYDFPVLLRCRKTSDTVFVAFVRPLSEPVRRFSSCSMDFSQQIAQVVYSFCISMFFSFKTVG